MTNLWHITKLLVHEIYNFMNENIYVIFFLIFHLYLLQGADGPPGGKGPPGPAGPPVGDT